MTNEMYEINDCAPVGLNCNLYSKPRASMPLAWHAGLMIHAPLVLKIYYELIL